MKLNETTSLFEENVIPSRLDHILKSQPSMHSRNSLRNFQYKFSVNRYLFAFIGLILIGITSISQAIVSARTWPNGIDSRVVAAQDVDLNLPLEAPLGILGDDNDQVAQTRLGRSKVKSLDEFLENLPILSVGQKHSAKFDCELSSELETFKLIWLRLSRASERADRTVQQQQDLKRANSTKRGNEDDIMLISLNQKIITPDKRFKVHRLSALRWTLSVDNVNANDSDAYYLCQVSSSSSSNTNSTTNGGVRSENLGSWFVGGARLNVLVPPKIVESETSPSLVQANEFEDLVLRCKVISEPQAQLMWKREDGQSLDEMDLEQKFRHETKRQNAIVKTSSSFKYTQIISIDSSELIFKPFKRHNAAAYLCIASNGVQPGVSQRVNVIAVNCRTSNSNVESSLNEPCDSESSSSRTRTSYPDDAFDAKYTATTAAAATTTTTASSTTAGRRKAWTSKSNHSNNNGKLELQRRLLDQRADKKRNGTLSASRNRNDLLVGNQLSIRNNNNNNNNNNDDDDSHSKLQQEASKANSFKDLQTTSSRALISLLFALLIVVHFLYSTSIQCYVFEAKHH